MKRKILIILGIIFLFAFSCGKKHEAVIHLEEVLKTLKSGNILTATSNPSLKIDPQTIKVFSEAYKKMDYKINNSKVKGNEVIINLKLKTPNLNAVPLEYVKIREAMNAQLQYKTEEEIIIEEENIMISIVKEKLNNPNLEYLDKTFDVVYKKIGNEWVIDENSNKDYAEAITFGMVQIVQTK